MVIAEHLADIWIGTVQVSVMGIGLYIIALVSYIFISRIPQTMMHICRDLGAVKIDPCSEHNIDVKGERKWVMIGPESDFVLDIHKGRVILKRQSGADSQKWWREGGFIRNKAYPDKVLAVEWPSSNFNRRPKGKLADLVLVGEDRTAYNQRWVYNKDDRTLESGVPGRYVIDCWHASSSLCVDGPVVVYQDLRSRKQQITITYDDLDRVSFNVHVLILPGFALKSL